jgi:hypothetical protein
VVNTGEREAAAREPRRRPRGVSAPGAATATQWTASRGRTSAHSAVPDPAAGDGRPWM